MGYTFAARRAGMYPASRFLPNLQVSERLTVIGLSSDT
jgi:hypothetical protein